MGPRVARDPKESGKATSEHRPSNDQERVRAERRPTGLGKCSWALFIDRYIRRHYRIRDRRAGNQCLPLNRPLHPSRLGESPSGLKTCPAPERAKGLPKGLGRGSVPFRDIVSVSSGNNIPCFLRLGGSWEDRPDRQQAFPAPHTRYRPERSDEPDGHTKLQDI